MTRRNKACPPSLPRLTLLPLSPRAQITDNVMDVAPPFIFFIGLVSFVKWKRKDILYHHRA